MELIMAAQDDPSPWELPTPVPTTNQQEQGSVEPPSPPAEQQQQQETLLGRGYFSQLGVVRRKPARGDAPPTLSKSCSDKIALKQCTSLLSSLTSLLVSPQNAYITTLILPESQYSPTACSRCFSAAASPSPSKEAEAPRRRMTSLSNKSWGGGYSFVPFSIEPTSLEFSFSKRSVSARSEKTSASNLAVAWTRNGLEESLIGGVLQGRKQFDLGGASLVSRRRMWSLARELVVAAAGNGTDELPLCLGQELAGNMRYDEVKEETGLLEVRRRVKEEARKEALKGWVRNSGDGAFCL